MQEPGPSQFKCLFEGCGKTFTRKVGPYRPVCPPSSAESARTTSSAMRTTVSHALYSPVTELRDTLLTGSCRL